MNNPAAESRELAASKIPDHQGENYVILLHRLHETLRPKSYLEIGTQAGQSLAVAKCNSVAIDPNFQIRSDVFSGKPACHLYQTGSDEFFASQDPKAIFGRPIDMAFLDGMHLFEFLLRDFMNVERHCSKNSIVAMHDCIPLDLFSARRVPASQEGRETSDHPDWWAGDVWKAVRILQKARPDLTILALDAPPTGLILITDLEPSSDVLHKNYAPLVKEALTWDLGEIGLENYVQSLNITQTSELGTHEQISRWFWL